MRFEIVRSSKPGQVFFRIVARNGQTVATSETYSSKRSALSTISSLRQRLGDAVVTDLTDQQTAEKAAAKKAAGKAARKAAKKSAAKKATAKKATAK